METSGLIWPNFKLIHALMYVIITCKYETDLIKNNREKPKHPFSNHITIRCHGNQWSDLAEFRTYPSLYACPHCLQVLKGSDKKSGENVMTSFLHYKSMGFFFRFSRAANSVVHGPISLNFELIQALMYIIVTCKYKMNPIKNVMTPFFPLLSYLLP